MYSPPPVNLEFELRNGNFITKAIGQNVTNCVNDVSDGGLAISLAEILHNSKTPNIGAIIDESFIKKCESFWFGEDQGRYLLEIDIKNVEKVENIFKKNNVFYEDIGSTQRDYLEIEEEMKKTHFSERLTEFSSNQ